MTKQDDQNMGDMLWKLRSKNTN